MARGSGFGARLLWFLILRLAGPKTWIRGRRTSGWPTAWDEAGSVQGWWLVNKCLFKCALCFFSLFPFILVMAVVFVKTQPHEGRLLPKGSAGQQGARHLGVYWKHSTRQQGPPNQDCNELCRWELMLYSTEFFLGVIDGSFEILKKNANSVSKKDILVTFPFWRQPPKFSKW